MFTFNFDLYSPSIDNRNIYCNFYCVPYSSFYIAIKQGLEFFIIGYAFMRYSFWNIYNLWNYGKYKLRKITILKIFDKSSTMDKYCEFTI